MFTSSLERPLAVYTDMDNVDFSAGRLLLESHGFDVSYLNSDNPSVIIHEARHATALLVGYADISRAVIDGLPNLKVIALMSMGFDNVDVSAATERGIWVTNIVDAATEEVATHALALILHSVRGLTYASQAAQHDRWYSRDSVEPQRLSECTLGVLGLGRIGLKLIELARPLFGEIVGYDPFLADTEESRSRLARAGVRRAPLEEVRQSAHVLTLHMPLTEDTAHMVDEAFLAAMPPSSFLINVSRGGLIDSQALKSAVGSGHIAGAALDVLDIEPPNPNHPLLGNERIFVTPHMAYYSVRSASEYVRLQAQNVVSWAQHAHPDSPVVALVPSSLSSS